MSADFTCLILAAGQSARMGRSKPLLPWSSGQSIIQHLVRVAQQAEVGDVCVVAGHDAALIAAELVSSDISIVVNYDYANQKMITSLQVGLRALAITTRAALIMLADMPLIGAHIIKDVVQAWRATGAWAVVPAYQGQRGHPVLFGRELWPTLLSLPPDAAPRDALRQYPQHIHLMPVDDPAILLDMDTPDAYHNLRAQAGLPPLTAD